MFRTYFTFSLECTSSASLLGWVFLFHLHEQLDLDLNLKLARFVFSLGNALHEQLDLKSRSKFQMQLNGFYKGF